MLRVLRCCHVRSHPFFFLHGMALCVLVRSCVAVAPHNPKGQLTRIGQCPAPSPLVASLVGPEPRCCHHKAGKKASIRSPLSPSGCLAAIRMWWHELDTCRGRVRLM